jgi:hypothetical protein
MKMDFSFILLLALSTVVDPHVKLRCTNMVVKSHKETLMEVMIFCKLRPATLEVHLTGPVIPDLHFIGSDACDGVIFSPSSWEPQEEGMMNIAARFFPQ